MKRIIDWLRYVAYLYLPVRRSTMQAAVAKANEFAERSFNDDRERLRKNYEKDLEKARASADAAINRCNDIQFNRLRDDQYAVTVCFDVRLFNGIQTRDEMDFIADRIGWQVAGEIRSRRFIAKATDLERERYDRRFPHGLRFA